MEFYRNGDINLEEKTFKITSIRHKSSCAKILISQQILRREIEYFQIPPKLSCERSGAALKPSVKYDNLSSKFCNRHTARIMAQYPSIGLSGVNHSFDLTTYPETMLVSMFGPTNAAMLKPTHPDGNEYFIDMPFYYIMEFYRNDDTELAERSGATLVDEFADLKDEIEIYIPK
ncbi:1606_t:CDS:2 [Funneliformis caledonium]|uniref:1606_t:CDS:1 n=1 Tax=Funneliformis caledonium TaxID=1117310 RepID=A0A9N9E9X0_9GLOM|nr:1606_t:CDS:2 [Funneliformis caledonium]